MIDFQQKKFLNYLLLPLSLLFFVLSSGRKWLYKVGFKKTTHFEVPIIVVGNISVGGTGKTPLTIALVEFLQSKDYQVGVVSRGYGGLASKQKNSTFVNKETDVKVSGDEPLLIVQRTGVKLVINKNRVQAVQDLLNQHDIDVVISDDGLQHYAMGRKIEIVVIDGQRRFGNGFLLPAGPLREGIKRLENVDFVINNNVTNSTNEILMRLEADKFVNLVTGEERGRDEFCFEKCYVIAGIGNPQRFFDLLENWQVRIIKYAYPDHYSYTAKDFKNKDDFPILMTQKDCVKCTDFATDNMWFVPISAKLEDNFYNELVKKL
jgi:tetraacyldisaccharide 4'-kinase